MLIETNDKGFKIECDNNINDQFLLTLISQLQNTRVPYENDLIRLSESIKETQNVADTKPIVNIRERLPNTLKKEEPTAKSGVAFRCPCCGQSHVIKVHDDIVVRDLEDKEGTLYLVKGVEPTEPYEVLSKNAIDKVKDIVADDTLVGYCPRCKNHEPLIKWFDAWINPEDYYDYSDPCPICGEEGLFNVTSTLSQTKLKCENQVCNYEWEVK